MLHCEQQLRESLHYGDDLFDCRPINLSRTPYARTQRIHCQSAGFIKNFVVVLKSKVAGYSSFQHAVRSNFSLVVRRTNFNSPIITSEASGFKGKGNGCKKKVGEW